jgi:hypothetical protein
MSNKNELNVNQLATFGDVRRMMLDTIVDLRSAEMDATRGMAIAANFKVLNDNINAEVGVSKLCLVTEGTLHEFGKVVGMGRKLIGNDASQLAA